MSAKSGIEWTDHSWSPWIGCDTCYAENDCCLRFHHVEWGPHAERKRRAPAYWRKPFAWNRKAEREGVRRRVFFAHYADVFDNKVPPEWRAEAFDIVRATRSLDWLILTKRPQNVLKMLPADWGDGWPNVWLGVTAENQTEAARRLPILSSLPAAVRFVSAEPLLEKVEFTQWLDRINWVICGGETDPQKKGRERFMDPDWARDLLRQCREAGVPFFMKQMTGRSPIPADLLVREWPADLREAAPGALPRRQGG